MDIYGSIVFQSCKQRWGFLHPKDHADVLKTLENAGFEISRAIATGISIKNPEAGWEKHQTQRRTV